MKPISSRPIFILSYLTSRNQKPIKNSQYLAFSTQTYQNPGSGHHSRRYEEESRAVTVSVWWDFENCNIPVNSNAFRVAQCITNAVRANGIKGPIQITAFGDVMQISRTNQEALSATGINLTHVPSGGKNSADRSLLVDLMYWVSQNPPPAHVFLITGDRDFAGILHRLRMNNYNILLASPDRAPSVLCSAATIMWQWSSLLKGDNLVGKLFNQPPDGPYNSWYGHYKAPLADPFAFPEQSSCLGADKSCDVTPDSKLRPIPKAVTEQSSSLGADESCDIAPDSRFRPIPKAVVKNISQILRSYPEGINITQLRTELGKTNLTIDRDLYGHKKFSRFLLAMPHILELHHGNDGQLLVRRINTKFHDESVPAASVEPGTKNGDPELKTESTDLGEAQKEEKQGESSMSMKMQDMKTKARAANMQNLKREEKRKVEVAPQVLVPDDHSSVFGFGIFRRILMKWFGSRYAKHDEALSGKDIVVKKTPASCESSQSIHPALFSPSSHEALIDGKIARSGDAVSGIPSQDSSSVFDTKVTQNGPMAGHLEVNSKQLEIFAKESFWKEIETFLDSTQGSAAFSKSRTRERLAVNLQKQGPPVLRSLSESELLHLVDLISDKKWVEECESRTFPFRLTRPDGKDLRSNRPFSSNGLSHIFSGRQSNLQESGERKHQNPPHTGVPQAMVHRGSLSKPRNELLADCQKLVDHIVMEYPEGFNIGGFRKVFLERYGYAVDLQKLGYDKLVNLLQIMPGVRIESNLILPAGEFKSLDPQNIDFYIQESKVGGLVDSQSDSSDLSTKDDDSDSFDELGPLESEKEETNARLTKKGQKGRIEQRLPDYEPLKEDDFSDSEEETSSFRSENESKSKLKGDESSLLEILNSWYDDKETDTKKDESVSATNVIDGGKTGLQLSTKNESAAVKPTRKQKAGGKSYSFIKEQPVDNNDKLVDGILSNLKKSSDKSGDSRVLS